VPKPTATTLHAGPRRPVRGGRTARLLERLTVAQQHDHAVAALGRDAAHEVGRLRQRRASAEPPWLTMFGSSASMYSSKRAVIDRERRQHVRATGEDDQAEAVAGQLAQQRRAKRRARSSRFGSCPPRASSARCRRRARR
jgi:hypothetical protein